MAFLTGLLASIIRPIIQEEIGELKDFIAVQLQRNDIYQKYDLEAQEIIEQIAKANTSEERWAYVRRLKETRAKLNL